MAAKINWHRYGTKLRTVTLCIKLILNFLSSSISQSVVIRLCTQSAPQAASPSARLGSSVDNIVSSSAFDIFCKMQVEVIAHLAGKNTAPQLRFCVFQTVNCQENAVSCCAIPVLSIFLDWLVFLYFESWPVSAPLVCQRSRIIRTRTFTLRELANCSSVWFSSRAMNTPLRGVKEKRRRLEIPIIM